MNNQARMAIRLFLSALTLFGALAAFGQEPGGNGDTKLNCNDGPCDSIARGRAAFCAINTLDAKPYPFLRIGNDDHRVLDAIERAGADGLRPSGGGLLRERTGCPREHERCRCRDRQKSRCSHRRFPGFSACSARSALISSPRAPSHSARSDHRRCDRLTLIVVVSPGRTSVSEANVS